MTTPTHLIFDSLILVLLYRFGAANINFSNLIIIFSANLIDLDHLFSRPIYDSRRNPFKSHFLHKNWPLNLFFSALLILFRPVMLLGVGIMAHLLLDLLDVKINKI